MPLSIVSPDDEDWSFDALGASDNSASGDERVAWSSKPVRALAISGSLRCASTNTGALRRSRGLRRGGSGGWAFLRDLMMPAA